MSLLWMDHTPEFQSLVDTACVIEEERNPSYFASLPAKTRDIIRRDTRYNIDFLYTAFALDDDKVMQNYAAWLYGLMFGIFKVKSPAEVGRYVEGHLACIEEAAGRDANPVHRDRLVRLLEEARAAVREAAASPLDEADFAACRYEDQIELYLKSLFARDTRGAMRLIRAFVAQGISIEDVYIDILAECMRRVGELWHAGRISVDAEHYCTSVTQTAMSQMYDRIFDAERCGKTVLMACPGAELHEMGARMLADIFENGGWDSIYLGAAVPEDYLLASIRENRPDVVALSVTMPQFLIDCQHLVEAIRAEFPRIVIGVGGGAFASTHEIWRRWPVDFHTKDAREALKRANELVGR